MEGDVSESCFHELGLRLNKRTKGKVMLKLIIFFIVLNMTYVMSIYAGDIIMFKEGIKIDQPNLARMLLSEVRGGDFAHPGDAQAIDMIVKKTNTFVDNLKSSTVLDVGCGFGGTVDYLSQLGFRDVQGCDLDQAAISYAQSRYIGLTFDRVDARLLHEHYRPFSFDFITLFNVAYAIENKDSLLHSLSQIAKPGAILAIFDYSGKHDIKDFPILDLAGKPMYPLFQDTLAINLVKNNWEVLEFEDITNQYRVWYNDLLVKLVAQELPLKQLFSVEDYDKVKRTFEGLLELISQDILGGGVIYAKKR